MNTSESEIVTCFETTGTHSSSTARTTEATDDAFGKRSKRCREPELSPENKIQVRRRDSWLQSLVGYVSSSSAMLIPNVVKRKFITDYFNIGNKTIGTRRNDNSAKMEVSSESLECKCCLLKSTRLSQCAFCRKAVCGECSADCEACSLVYCRRCSLIDYSKENSRAFCLDCSSI